MFLAVTQTRDAADLILNIDQIDRIVEFIPTRNDTNNDAKAIIFYKTGKEQEYELHQTNKTLDSLEDGDKSRTIVKEPEHYRYYVRETAESIRARMKSANILI